MTKTAFESHFDVRWRERGNTLYDGKAVRQIIEAAYLKVRDTGHSNVLDFVQFEPDDSGLGYYRFVIDGTSYYAMMNLITGKAVTVFTQRMMAKRKWKRRNRKKWRSAVAHKRKHTV